jgi:SET domain-containing protein
MHQQHPGLYFAPSGKHRYGMFCSEDILKESIIEICPILLMAGEQAAFIKKGHILYEYYFEWSDDQMAIALGYGSLYNHDTHPNASFDPDYAFEHIVFRAIKDIPAGDEIVVDYHAGSPDEKLWFEVK